MPGRHVRLAGREAAAGDVLASAGRPLTPPLLAMAGISGHDDVPVLPPVTAALLLTGDEVRTSGTPAAGEVRDAFEVQLPHVLRAAGIEVVAVRRIGDDRTVTREALAELVDLADVVVSTGGTGRSGADHVRAVLTETAGIPSGPRRRRRRSDHHRRAGDAPGSPHDAHAARSARPRGDRAGRCRAQCP